MPAASGRRCSRRLDEPDSPGAAGRAAADDRARERRPAHGGFWIRGVNSVRRAHRDHGHPDRRAEREFLGAVAIFWEVSRMRVTLWGTRGSLAGAGPRDRALRRQHRLRRGARQRRHACWSRRRHRHPPPRRADPAPTSPRVDILLTHLHMDHIQGLGFFAPALRPGHRGPHLGAGEHHAVAARRA